MPSLLRRVLQRPGARLQSLRRVWDLRPDDCPCDIHFVEWMQQRGGQGETVFHFGTGGHHYVGARLAGGEARTSVMGITATQREYDAYVDLVTRNPRLARDYVVYFGDIYTANAALLPAFDVATLFHLCEFRTAANDAYGALTDAELVEVIWSRVRPNGRLLFYTGSYAYAKAEAVIEAWSDGRDVEEVEGFKTLRIFRKTSALI